MKRFKALFALTVVLMCLRLLAPGQQRSASVPQNAMQRFLGTWELHMKEGPGVPERESLTFEQTANGLQITHLIAFESGTVLHYSGMMDPKGNFVQMRQIDGKPMNEEWRVVSVDAAELIIETRPFGGKKKYQLSADGRLMKMSRLSQTLMGNPPLPDLTFQRSE